MRFGRASTPPPFPRAIAGRAGLHPFCRTTGRDAAAALGGGGAVGRRALVLYRLGNQAKKPAMGRHRRHARAPRAPRRALSPDGRRSRGRCWGALARERSSEGEGIDGGERRESSFPCWGWRRPVGGRRARRGRVRVHPGRRWARGAWRQMGATGAFAGADATAIFFFAFQRGKREREGQEGDLRAADARFGRRLFAFRRGFGPGGGSGTRRCGLRRGSASILLRHPLASSLFSALPLPPSPSVSFPSPLRRSLSPAHRSIPATRASGGLLQIEH